jgi:hypothetical protein
MVEECDWLLATGEAAQRGPQFLAASSILAIARALADLGQRAAILAVDPNQDPALVARDSNEGVPIFFTSRPAATLPALRVAIGCPRVLCLPNQLDTYDLTRTEDLPLTVWLGEDDLASLAVRRLPGRPCLLADSATVARAAARLTRQPVPILTPPLTQTDIVAPPASAAGIAVIGARPQDGIELVLQLAAQRRDLRFIIAEWPILEDESRAALFASALASGNIDWRRPANPSALAAIVAEAALVLAPAMRPTGHRDWLMQAARLGRPVLRSDLVDGTGLGDHPGAGDDPGTKARQAVPADASVTVWLQALETSLIDAAAGLLPPMPHPAEPVSAVDTAAGLLSHSAADHATGC